ncbi:MAG: hypothetical protein NZ898_14840 [Myxococcota bacterium]|nr:hypothetical protein [Myxococcota bacterium]MDW8361126.1 hypothetical protein [Myxococcales bacterium]
MLHSRREFLKVIAASAGASALARGLVGCGQEGEPPGPGGRDAATDAARDAAPSDTGVDAVAMDRAAPDDGAQPDATEREDGRMPDDASMAMEGGGGTSCTSPSVTIGDNHGHEMTVTAADVEAGVEKTYGIQGTSRHPHTVTLTAAHFADLRAGRTVMVRSSTDAAHAHDITVRCA